MFIFLIVEEILLFSINFPVSFADDIAESIDSCFHDIPAFSRNVYFHRRAVGKEIETCYKGIQSDYDS